MNSLIVKCTACGTANRLPAGKQHLDPKCGRCGKKLPVLFKGQGTWFYAPLQEHSHKPEEQYAVIERISELMSGFVSDRDFLDMLRILQVAILQGEVQPEELTSLRGQLAEEFPAGDFRAAFGLFEPEVVLLGLTVSARAYALQVAEAALPDERRQLAEVLAEERLAGKG